MMQLLAESMTDEIWLAVKGSVVAAIVALIGWFTKVMLPQLRDWAAARVELSRAQARMLDAAVKVVGQIPLQGEMIRHMLHRTQKGIRKQLLLFEDNDDDARILKELLADGLTQRNAKIFRITRLEECDKDLWNDSDAVLADANLPDANWSQVFQFVTNNGNRNVAMYSGNDDPALKRKCERDGIKYLSKNDLDNLVIEVLKMLD